LPDMVCSLWGYWLLERQMNDVGRYLDKIGASVCAVFDWTEKHPGLGGWVGAVGSILAILAAWYLARREYLRIKRQTAARRRAEIDLIGTVNSEFEAIVKRYADAAITDKPEALHFFNNHMNDSELNGMYDLVHIPVTQWPSLEAYANFKRYWWFSLKVLETSNAATIDKSELDVQLRQHDVWLIKVRDVLKTARRY
jgi:hypothetical protein